MGAMIAPPRHLATLFALVILLAVALIGCVPDPVGRETQTPASPAPSGTATQSPVPTGPTPPPSFVRPTATPLPTFFVHVVAAGESLTSIARRYGTSPFSLAVWNRDTYPSLDPEADGYEPNRIQAGWLLRLIPGREVDPEDLLDPTPSPMTPPTAPPATPAPTTSGAATPRPSLSGAATVVRHGSRSTPTVALTFDMGGRLDPALDILGWLVANDVPATIFPTGKTGTGTTQGLAALDIVASHRNLFDLGNHSWSHPDFRDLDAAAMRSQLERSESALLATINMSTRPWFRPPFGGLDDQVPAVVGAAGWSHIVMWDVDTIDWRPLSDGGPTAADMVDKVVSKSKAGSIVLMHLGGYNTLEALPGIVDGLRARGLTPVTLDTMFGG